MIYFSKVEKSEQPNDCEYAIFNEEKTLIAKAVIFQLIDGYTVSEIMDIAEIKPYIPIQLFIEKIIEFAKLNNKRCIYFPRIVTCDNKYYEDENILNIYDNHGSRNEFEDDSEDEDNCNKSNIHSFTEPTTSGVNNEIYKHLNEYYDIDSRIIKEDDRSSKLFGYNYMYRTVMPILFFKKKYKIKNPLKIRIEYLETNKYSDNTNPKVVSFIETNCSIHSYTMPISKIKKIDYDNSVKNRYIKQGQKMMDCCELVLEETCLMEFYQNSPSCNDTYLNVYINGVNANVKSLDCFRLNKWNNWTSNDIMCIEPTYAYQHIYKKRTHLASFTSIVFYKDYIYNEDSYKFFITYSTTDKLPKLVNNFYYDKKECAEETNITITEEEQIICDEENCISYIYLIREREFINKNEQVYKVGRTTQERGLTIYRFKA